MVSSLDFAAAYKTALEEAAEQWGTNFGECTAWGRQALSALIAGHLTPVELAQTVYDIISPLDAWGRPAKPKMLRGRLTVRNIENATNPVRGSQAARKSLEAVLLIYDAQDLAKTDIERFIAGEGKLYGLSATVKQLRAGDNACAPERASSVLPSCNELQLPSRGLGRPEGGPR